MKRMFKAAWLVLALCTALPAEAAYDSYYARNFVSVSPHATAVAVASCPAPYVALGGGWLAGDPGLVINASYGTSGTWVVTANNLTGDYQTLGAWATCVSSTTGSIGVKVVSRNVTAIPGYTVCTTANLYPSPCPYGYYATAGGFDLGASTTPDMMYVPINYYDITYRNNWVTCVANPSQTGYAARAYTTCAKVPQNQVRLVAADSVVIPPYQQAGTSPSAYCPSGSTAIGSGYYDYYACSGGANCDLRNVRVTSSWVQGMQLYNGNSGSQKASIYATCLMP
jgi:hypothetical protein